MKTGLHQHVGLRQDLRINPPPVQAMDLLLHAVLDLQQHLKQELLGNPFLEMLEPERRPKVRAPSRSPPIRRRNRGTTNPTGKPS